MNLVLQDVFTSERGVGDEINLLIYGGKRARLQIRAGTETIFLHPNDLKRIRGALQYAESVDSFYEELGKEQKND